MSSHRTNRRRQNNWHCWVLAATLLGIAPFRPTVAQEETPLYPLAVAVAENGTVYVADLHLPGIWTLKDGKATIYYKASKRFRTPLNRVRSLAIDNEGRLLAGDSATREIYRFSDDVKPEPLTGGAIGIPIVLAVDKEGTIFASDLETQRIWSIPAEGLSEGEQPKEVAVIAGVRGLAFDSQGRLVTATTREDPIRRIGAEGEVTTLLEGRPFDFPHQITIADDGTVYVTDNYAATIWKVPPGPGEQQPFVKDDPLDKPVGLTMHKKNLIVADPHARAVFQISPEGKLTPLLE